MKIRTYTELLRLRTLEERFDYLNLRGNVGEVTFGYDRWINQAFYGSREWKSIRDEILLRDLGSDLGIYGYLIHRKPIIHHMNPMVKIDITSGNTNILDPEYLITTSLRTHNAIHYGNKSLLPRELVPRRSGDTTLWKRKETG